MLDKVKDKKIKALKLFGDASALNIPLDDGTLLMVSLFREDYDDYSLLVEIKTPDGKTYDSQAHLDNIERGHFVEDLETEVQGYVEGFGDGYCVLVRKSSGEIIEINANCLRIRE